MLEATTSAFSRDYAVKENGLEIAFIGQSIWKEKATLNVGGYSFTMRRDGVMSSAYVLEGSDGSLLASARKSVWQHNYEVGCAEGQFRLQRNSMWTNNYTLLANEQQIGYVSKQSAWGRNAVAELANLSLVIRCFLLWLVLISWQEAQAAAASAVH